MTGLATEARRIAATVLGEVDRPAAAEALVGLLRDPDASVRSEAAVALRGRQDAAKWLVRNVLHPEREIRGITARALGKIGGNQARSALRHAARTEKDRDVLEAIQRALRETEGD